MKSTLTQADIAVVTKIALKVSQLQHAGGGLSEKQIKETLKLLKENESEKSTPPNRELFGELQRKIQDLTLQNKKLSETFQKNLKDQDLINKGLAAETTENPISRLFWTVSGSVSGWLARSKAENKPMCQVVSMSHDSEAPSLSHTSGPSSLDATQTHLHDMV